MSGPLQPLKAALRRRQRLWQLRGLTTSPAPPPLVHDEPISIYGLFGATAGLGEAARLLARGLEDLGHRVHRIDCTAHLIPGRPENAADSAHGLDADPGRGPVIVHLNPVEAAEVLAAFKPVNLMARRRIGVWLYELSGAPSYWARYAPFFHDVWTPSPSSAVALQAIGLTPALVPYRHQPIARRDRRAGDRFRVLVMADYHSSLARKNVVGAVRAFREAFSEDIPAELWLKLSNMPDGHELLSQVGEDPRIAVMRDPLDLPATLSLIGDADVLLSLHRAEGYGLTLAEALLLGTPIVISDEPTTRGFQLPDAVSPVPGAHIPVDDPQGIYTSGTWFDADPARAAQALREQFAAWRNGLAATERQARIARAEAHLTTDERLAPLRAALGSA